MNLLLACTGSIGSTKVVELVKAIKQKNNDVSLLRSFKVGPTPSIKVGFICFNETSLKMVRNAFYFTLKVLSFFRFSIFFPDVFGHAGKRLDKKDQVNFKTYDVTNWEADNNETHITRYLKKQRQSDKES